MKIIKYTDYVGSNNILHELMGIIPIGAKLDTYEEDIKTSALNEIEFIKQQKQAPYDLNQQLEELIIAANKLGLYDAADLIKKQIIK